MLGERTGRAAAGEAAIAEIPSNEALGTIQYAFSGRVFRRNLLIALIVGTLLTIANQFDVILRNPVHLSLLVKMCLNFAIPPCGVFGSAYANRCGPQFVHSESRDCSALGENVLCGLP